MRDIKAGSRYLLRLETDEDILEAIARFAADQRIDAAALSGIGSIHSAVLGYFDRGERKYHRRSFAGDLEIVSLAGNLSLKEGRPYPHVHVTLSGADFQAVAGHLFEGKTAATCEILVDPLTAVIERREDTATGLWLLQ